MKDLVFWGAGKLGVEALEKFRMCNSSLYNFRGYCDKYKIGTYEEYPIITINELEKNVIIVITIKNLEWVAECYNYLEQLGYKNVYLYLEKSEEVDCTVDFLKKYCLLCKDWGDNILPQVEMHVVDYCNLNCRACAHYSPIFPKEFPNVDERIHDIESLKEKFSHIIRFFLMGGEPFLHPQIIKYIERTRELLPNTDIQIVTNGLLIPNLDKSILNAIFENGITISISVYRPTKNVLNKIEERLREFKISYNIRTYEKKLKFNKPLSLSESSKYKQKCNSIGCINIWEGKIARCPLLMYIDEFNKKFGVSLPNEGIISLEDPIQGKELIDLLKKEVPLCKHCVDNEIEWTVCGKNISVEDFATLD